MTAMCTETSCHDSRVVFVKISKLDVALLNLDLLVKTGILFGIVGGKKFGPMED